MPEGKYNMRAETEEKLSVIVPVYNAAPYLRRCLDSIICQNYKNMEIICVNDGSTDNSGAILETYAAEYPYIHVIHQENMGMGCARNAGIKAACGYYMTFVDSDDYLDCAAYQTAIRKFAADIDIVCFAAEIVVENGGKKFKGDDRYYATHQEGETALTPDIIMGENVSVCNKIFRAELIRAKKILFPEGLWYEDAEFYWKYMANAGKAWFLKDKFYKYVRRRQSTMYQTFRGSDRAIDHLYIIDNIFSYFIANGKSAFFQEIGGRLFDIYFWLAYRHSIASHRRQVLHYAGNIVAKYGLVDKFPHNRLMKNIAQRRFYKYKSIDEYSFWQKLFSVKKMSYTRYIRFLGFKFEMRRNCYKHMKDFLES